MVERKAFPIKPKLQYRDPNKENVFMCQSWKECRLLRESKFISFDGWTLALRKIVER